MSDQNVVYEPVNTSIWAIVSLLSGIAGFNVLPLIGPIVAIITGYVAKNEIKKSNGTLGGGGMATAGLIMGWIAVALAILGFVLVILLIFGVISGFAFCGPLTNWIQNY